MKKKTTIKAAPKKPARRSRNPFYEKAKEGIEILVPTTSSTELTVRNSKGRPPYGEGVGPSTVKSVRLPDDIWRRLDEQAAREGVTSHAAIRQAVLIWLRS